MLRKLSLFLPLAVVVLFAAAPLRGHAQKTIYVYGVNPPPNYPYTTIQSGIDAASDGDTVQVGLGSYFENISFKGKAITVNGFVDSTTGAMPAIQGATAEPAVVFQTGETSSSVLSHFIIHIGGSGSEPPYPKPHGPYYLLPGAIYVSGASPSILNNTISQSHCFGVYVQAGAPVIQGNEIDSTYIDSQCPPVPTGVGSGVGIFITGDNPLGLPVVSANVIQNNTQGGADTFAIPGGGGAGITLVGPAIIENNTIRNNNANSTVGGGINIEALDRVFILQNLIYGNSAACGGGGIALPGQPLAGGSTILIANNTIVNNVSGPSYASHCAPSTQLFSLDNALDDPGPGVVIVNNILSGSSTDASVDCGETETPDEIYQPIFDHNILHNAGGSFFGQYCVDVSSKYGNLTADPAFDPNSPYHLTSGSPAIDAGNTSVLQLFQQLSGSQLTTDFDGYPRVIDFKGIGYPTIDIGAYEYPDQKLTAPQVPTTMVLSFAQGNGKPNSLTATLKSPQGTPTDTVSFFVDSAPLGSAVIDGSGTATLSKFLLTPGTHALSATYPGHGQFTPAIAIINVVATTIIPTKILLTSYSVPPPLGQPSLQSVVGQSVTFTITSSATDGTIPSPVTLTITNSENVVISKFTIDQFDSEDMAQVTTTFSTIGDYIVDAAYAGNQYYTEGSDTLKQHVIGYPTTITLHCPPAYPSIPFGGTATITATVTSPDGTPQGVVDFSDAGLSLGMPTLLNGSASILYTATSPGPRTIIAQYPATGAFGASFTTCPITVSPQNTLALTSSSPLVNGIPTSPAYSPITFTAALTSSNNLTGTYTLNIQGQPVATMQPSASGTTATYTTNSLAPGQYTVSATFTSTDKSVSITTNLYPYQLVTTPIGDFTLTGPPTITTTTEKSASGTLSLASIDGFQGTVALTCSLPLPTTYTCAVSPTSVPLTVGGTGSAIVTLAPTLRRAANDSTSPIVFASLFPLTLLSLTGFFRRRKLSAILPLVILAFLAACTTACGNDIAFPATQPGSYPFTITATGTTKGATTPTTHTLNITLILTP